MISLSDFFVHPPTEMGITLNCTCSSCGHNVPRCYKYARDIEFMLCSLCNIIYKYDEHQFKYGILCCSAVKQQEIIDKTHKSITNQKRMPNIKEIDPAAMFLNVSMCDIVQVLIKGTNDDLQNFNLKIFFTDKLNFDALCYKRFGIFGAQQYAKYNDFMFFVHNALPKINPTQKQMDIINKFKVSFHK